MKRWTMRTAVVLGLTLVLVQVPGWTQDKAGKTVTSEQLKKMLDGLGRKYTTNAEGDFLLRVAKPGAAGIEYRCFLYTFAKGHAVVITCNGFQSGDNTFRLKSVPSGDEKAVDELLDRINQWNVNKALTRAIMTKGTDKAGKNIFYARLEADIDWEIGVTDKKIDHLIKEFTRSLLEFESFLVGQIRKVEDLPKVAPKKTDKVGAGQETVHFPLNAQGKDIQSSWRVHYTIDRRHGLCISGAWFKKKAEADWFKVIEDLRVSTLYVPYEDGTPRYFDMDIDVPPYMQHGPWALATLVGAEQNLIGPNGMKVGDYLVRENRDAGLLWLFSDSHETMKDPRLTMPRHGKTFVHRRQEMVLWSVFQASNYFYVMQYSFHNDGTVNCRLGSTGQNLHDHAGKGTGHMHNAGWRVHLDLGGSGPEAAEKKLAESIDVFRVIHVEDPAGQGKASTSEGRAIANEDSFDWHAEQFTLMRVRNSKDPKARNDLNHPVSYDLVPLRIGVGRHFAPAHDFDESEHMEKKLNRPSDEFTQHDFWVTNLDPAQTHFEQLASYVKEKKQLKGNPVLWHWSSNLHSPRDEDFVGPEKEKQSRARGCAVVMWNGFDLRPRNLFNGTPYLTPGK